MLRWCLQGAILTSLPLPLLLLLLLWLLTYAGYTVFAGVRRLLFRQEGVSTTEVPHFFKYRAPAAGPSALGLDQPHRISEADAAPSQHTIRAKDQAAREGLAKHGLEAVLQAKAAAA